MDAIEFLKKLKRMCDKNRASCHGSCYACEIFVKKAEKAIGCSSFIKEYPEEAVTIIEKWSAEHPAKTRQSEFLKLHPNAKLMNTGILKCCPAYIDKKYKCSVSCDECLEEYWLEEVE